jgi:hypothetical protein
VLLIGIDYNHNTLETKVVFDEVKLSLPSHWYHLVIAGPNRQPGSSGFRHVREIIKVNTRTPIECQPECSRKLGQDGSEFMGVIASADGHHVYLPSFRSPAEQLDRLLQTESLL